jgi:hypothetical protein
VDASGGLTFSKQDLSARVQETQIAGVGRVNGLQERRGISSRLIHRESGWFLHFYFLCARHVRLPLNTLTSATLMPSEKWPIQEFCCAAAGNNSQPDNLVRKIPQR